MTIRLHKWLRQTQSLICVCTCLLIQANTIEAQDRHPRTNGDGNPGCPATKAADAFVPTSPYKNVASSRSFFFGTPKLWTLVHPSSWTGQKLVWFSPGTDRTTNISPGLTVTLKRLDAPAALRKIDHANWALIDGQPPFITTGFNSPPTTGCWEITGRLGSEEVKYVVWLGID